MAVAIVIALVVMAIVALAVMTGCISYVVVGDDAYGSSYSVVVRVRVVVVVVVHVHATGDAASARLVVRLLLLPLGVLHRQRVSGTRVLALGGGGG